MLTGLSKAFAERCVACPLCRRECAFLERYGNPQEIAARIDLRDDATLTLAYECSLCGLCGAVCPVNLEPRDLFLEMRRAAVAKGIAPFSAHRQLLAYEQRGMSKRYSYYGLPDGCHSVFFPGCGLPGTRPQRTLETYHRLRSIIADLGIVLDCCTKPSHDLGRQAFFLKAFGEIRDSLLGFGVRTVLTACPNCYRVFKEYGKDLAVKTVYEVLDLPSAPVRAVLDGNPVVIHDPCAVRGEKLVHEAVRNLVRKMGSAWEEMTHHGLKTLCCGEGGGVGLMDPGLSRKWGQIRLEESGNRDMITYCVGCSHILGKQTPTWHLLDLLFETPAARRRRVKSAAPPWTYLNRLRLKRTLKKSIPEWASRVRTAS